MKPVRPARPPHEPSPPQPADRAWWTFKPGGIVCGFGRVERFTAAVPEKTGNPFAVMRHAGVTPDSTEKFHPRREIRYRGSVSR